MDSSSETLNRRIEWPYVRVYWSYREDMNHTGCVGVEHIVGILHVCLILV